jgi:hypothetical protein
MDESRTRPSHARVSMANGVDAGCRCTVTITFVLASAFRGIPGFRMKYANTASESECVSLTTAQELGTANLTRDRIAVTR